MFYVIPFWRKQQSHMSISSSWHHQKRLIFFIGYIDQNILFYLDPKWKIDQWLHQLKNHAKQYIIVDQMIFKKVFSSPQRRQIWLVWNLSDKLLLFFSYLFQQSITESFTLVMIWWFHSCINCIMYWTWCKFLSILHQTGHGWGPNSWESRDIHVKHSSVFQSLTKVVRSNFFKKLWIVDSCGRIFT